MVRVPLARGAGTRVENRLPEAATNPYVAAAGMIATGVLGLNEGASGATFIDGNAYLLDLPSLPASLEHALEALEADPDLRRILGEPFLRLYGAIKRNELRRFRAHVTDWERHEYLELA
jgi:glutamine synthetase